MDLQLAVLILSTVSAMNVKTAAAAAAAYPVWLLVMRSSAETVEKTS
jgi:hypothetical protein